MTSSRQIISALGLTSVAGQAQTVRPLVAPMAIAAAEKQHGHANGLDNPALMANVTIVGQSDIGLLGRARSRAN